MKYFRNQGDCSKDEGQRDKTQACPWEMKTIPYAIWDRGEKVVKASIT
jgi:hypothetical protein